MDTIEKYNRQEFYEYLLSKDYSKEIANELSDVFAYNCEKSYERGVDDAVKAHNVFRRLAEHLNTGNTEALIIAIREGMKSEVRYQAAIHRKEDLIRDAIAYALGVAVGTITHKQKVSFNVNEIADQWLQQYEPEQKGGGNGIR